MSQFNFNDVIEWGALNETEREEILRRPAVMAGDRIKTVVEGILEAVRERGDEALREFSAKFDRTEVKDFRVSAEEVDAAVARLPEDFMAALKTAAANIEKFHSAEVLEPVTVETMPGVVCQQVTRPIGAVGLYIPGGTAPLFSTVLMLGIPAKIAGCGRVILCSPPPIADPILAAARLCGIDEIYQVGGAQAVAALAYGTETIPRVDKITGPGNAFVAAAKQIVSGDVGIDMVAGPSEVCVLADATAKPMVVAADLMAQAEHDPLAACYLVTCDEWFAREVEAGIDILVAQSPRAEITRASLDNEGTIVVAADMAAAVEAVNTVAPEHLELHCKDAMGLLGGIRNAGAIFVGAWSSEPLGDYVAGPNHTLPTGGTAMFSNPLSVEEFVKRSSVICYTPEGLLSDAPATQRLAEAEGLWAHALSAALRRRVLEQGEDAVSAESLAAADLTKVAWPGDAVATVAEGVDLAAAAGGAAGATGEEA